MTLLTTAYAGSGDISDANLDALLNQLLPDGPLGMVYIPEGTIVKRNQPGLAKVVNWLQNNENGVGVEGTIPVPNLLQAMLDRNDKLATEDDQELDELVLVMVFNPSSGLDRSLVEEAHAKGIRVIDLANAGDDIVPEPPADEVPTDPTPPPAEEEPPFEPDPPKDEPQSEAGKAVTRATRAAKAARDRSPAPEPVVEVPAAPVGTPELVLNIQMKIAPEHVATLARAIVEAMGAQAQSVVAAPAPEPPAPLASVTPIGTTGNNPADPAGQPEGTKPFYYNAGEGKYRPARGVKRKNEERVFLNDDEIAEAKANKMLG